MKKNIKEIASELLSRLQKMNKDDRKKLMEFLEAATKAGESFHQSNQVNPEDLRKPII